MKGVHTFRNIRNSKEIYSKAKLSKNIVVVGAGFLGMELAATLKDNFPYCNITIIDRNNCPFEKVLGRQIGEFFQK